MIKLYGNPPRKRRRRKLFGAALAARQRRLSKLKRRRGVKSRKRTRRNPMARTRRRRRRNPPKGYRKLRGRRRARGAGGRFLKKGAKYGIPVRRRRRRKGRKASSRRRRSHARRPRSTRRRRTRSGRSPRRRRYASWRGLTRRRGVRGAARIWRKRKKYVRMNPLGFLPSIRDGKEIAKGGAIAALGWVGTNALMMVLDRYVLGNVKAKITDSKVLLLANFVERTISAYAAARLLGMVVKGGNSAQLLRIGGGLNVALHTAQDVVSTFSVNLPSWGAPMLLGYRGGMGGFVTQGDLGVAGYGSRLGNYITAGVAPRNVGGSLASAGYRSAFG